MNFLLTRDVIESEFTLGTLSYKETSTALIGYTCEDRDRLLEIYPDRKIKGTSAIPRGTYKLTVSYSNRFKKNMVELLNVPGFSGIRVHGGNTNEDTEGCILLGEVRTSEGVAKCKALNLFFVSLIQAIAETGEDSYMEIK